MKTRHLTKRAVDGGDSAAFSNIFLASSFLCSQSESTPAHTQVTQTVRWLNMYTNYETHRKMGEIWRLNMPQYHKANFDRYVIETKPKTFLRKWFPYFVGNKVAFLMRITDSEQMVDSTTLYVFEVFGDRERRIKEIERQTLPEGWIPISGNPIEREGDVIYSVGSSYGGKNTVPLFTARVINTDRWSLGCIGFILGTISSVIAGIIIALINVRNPAWDIWIPDFIMDWLRRLFQ